MPRKKATPKPIQIPPPAVSPVSEIYPGRKMLWFKDRSVWTHEMHVAELKDRIAQCEEDDEDPSYWQKELSRYMASLRT